MTGPTAGRPDWRDGASYEALRGIDRAGVMWEFLRRDPGYIAWHAKASAITGGALSRVSTASALKWGLHFRRAARRRRTRCTDHLGRVP